MPTATALILPGQPPGPVSPRTLVLVPVFNHARSLRAVVRGILAQHPDVLVVDDGCTDMPPEITGEHPLYGLPASYLRLPENRGKGAAVMAGATEARRMGMTHILTIDADGQHDPADIPAFIQAATEAPMALFVGERDFNVPNVPASSRFGRSFSNFWYKVHTGEETRDVQSGFRLYPLTLLELIRCRETRYSFETEILVRASWSGFAVRNIPIKVYYPPRQERVSHFQPLMDNVRISLLNTRLTIRSIMPIPHKKYGQDRQGEITVLRPLRSMRQLLADNATPRNLALASAVGMFVGTLPLLGLHSILIILLCGAWRLNKICGLAVSQLCIPPFVPAFCIETGHYLRYGNFLTEISLQTLGYEAPARAIEWVLGSLLLAPVLACICGLMALGLAKSVQKGICGDTVS